MDSAVEKDGTRLLKKTSAHFTLSLLLSNNNVKKIGVKLNVWKAQESSGMYLRCNNINLNKRSNKRVARDKESLERHNDYDSLGWSLKLKVRKFIAFLTGV